MKSMKIVTSTVMFSVMLLLAAIISMPDSHSCPEPGHGPCYLCDK